jgi:hypothetical protein
MTISRCSHGKFATEQSMGRTHHSRHAEVELGTFEASLLKEGDHEATEAAVDMESELAKYKAEQ